MPNVGQYVNPIGTGLKPARIDMGVDYTGKGTLYALGSGVITNVFNSGWPGGKFIGLHLDTGQYVYYAENIIPRVSVGQKVSAGTPIAEAVGTYPYTEIGWAAAPGTGQTMAAKAGQSAKGSAAGDPGKYSTGYGVNMSNLIKSLGGPAGILTSGGVQGDAGTTADTGTGASGSALPGCIPLIWVIWYAILCCQKLRWNVPRNGCGWQSPHETRQQRRRRKTGTSTRRNRRRHHIPSSGKA